MAKDASPKLDMLRQMREAQYAKAPAVKAPKAKKPADKKPKA